MNAISSRINGQPEYHPAPEARAAWREEMLDQLLTQMRDRQLPGDQITPSTKLVGTPGKGSYVDIYV